MTEKQKIYQQLLLWSLPDIRNVQSGGFIQKGKDKSCYYAAEFIHDLHVSMYEESYVDHDLWILNYHAKYFIDNCNQKIFWGYPMFCEYLFCLLYTSPSPRDKRQSRMPSSA